MVSRRLDDARAALGFLTRLPIGRATVHGTGAAAFPLVGSLVGVAGGVLVLLVAPAEPVLAAIAAVAVMALLSGALHLDGLADTVDALAAQDPAGAERARKDPASGPAGTTALILVLGAQVAALASLAAGVGGPTVGAAACVVAGAASRAMPVVMAAVGRTRTLADGSAAWFVAGVTNVDVAVACGSALLVVVIVAAGTEVPALVAGVAAGVLAAGAAMTGIVGARRQLDGDVFGAGVELTVTAVLAAIAWVA